MNDLIDREKAIEDLQNRDPSKLYDIEDIEYWINSLPSVEPERKKGEWIELGNSSHNYICSLCGRMLVGVTDGKNRVAKNYPFCHCGADMRGESDE